MPWYLYNATRHWWLMDLGERMRCSGSTGFCPKSRLFPPRSQRQALVCTAHRSPGQRWCEIIIENELGLVFLFVIPPDTLYVSMPHYRSQLNYFGPHILSCIHALCNCYFLAALAALGLPWIFTHWLTDCSEFRALHSKPKPWKSIPDLPTGSTYLLDQPTWPNHLTFPLEPSESEDITFRI